jgi:hypothetical protein
MVICLTACSPSTVIQHSPTPPDSAAYGVYESLNLEDGSLQMDASKLPEYTGTLAGVTGVLRASDATHLEIATDGTSEILKALALPDVNDPAGFLPAFVGLPIFVLTADGQVWRIHQPRDKEANAVRKELRAALDSATWAPFDG